MRNLSLVTGLNLLVSLPLFSQPVPVNSSELPALRAASEINPKIQALGEPWTVDLSSREESRQFYRAMYGISSDVPSGWNGDIANGNPGSTTAAFKEAVINRVNFYRALAGVPAQVTINSTFSAKAQQAALIMSANKALSHFPASQPGWVHVTADGAEAADKSNLGIGTRGPDTMDGYIRDHGAGNQEVGHRRWIFHAATREMGTGDVEAQGEFSPANALWVQDALVSSPRPATRDEFVAWPPKGHVPAPLVWPRWSFALPGANFSGATVSMKRNGTPIATQIEAAVTGNSLDSILVWLYDGKSGDDRESHPAPETDVNYEVTVSNVAVGGTTKSFTYTVTVFDPDSPGSDFSPTTISGSAAPGTGGPSPYTVNVPSFGTGFYWRELDLAAFNSTFGAENDLQGVIDGSSADYSPRVSSPTASGNGAYHLANPRRGVEILTLPSAYLLSASATLNFQSRLGFVTLNQIATVEVSLNGGVSWSTVYEQAGTSTGSGLSETSFQSRSVDLSAYANQTVRLRFALTFQNGSFFNETTANFGWLIDDISLSNAEVATVLKSSSHTTGSTFDYTASSTGRKALQARGGFFNNYAMDWGPVLSVTANSGSGSGNSGGGGSSNDTSRIVNMSVRSVSGTGADALSVGMVVGGSGSKSLLIRVVGPTLGGFGVPGVVSDPRLELSRRQGSDNIPVTDNDNWGGSGSLSSLFSKLGAFPLSSNLDAALSTSLQTSVYNVVVDTKGGSGVALVEAYDTEDVTSGTARLINVSARSQVGTGGDVLVAGFVISGTGNKTLLIRGVGATLGNFGLTGVLQNPQLIVHKDNGTILIASNDNWDNNASITSTAQTLGAFALSSTSDAALLVTLAPGSYTATVSGVNDTTGIALVEVYEVP